MRAVPVAVALLLVASGTGRAWVSGPPGGSQADLASEPLVVVATGAAPRIDRTVVPARSLLTRTLPAGWQGTLDRDTGVVTQLWGGFIVAPGSIADVAIAEQAARTFLAAHLALLAPGSNLADFVLAANQLDGGLRTVSFHQTWRGLRVIGGSVYVVFGRDRLFVAGSTAVPDIGARLAATTGVASGSTATAMVRAPNVIVNSRRAEAWITASMGVPVVTRAIGDRVILPIVRDARDTTSLGVIDVVVADHLDIEAVGSPGRWDVYVATDGAPVLRATRLRFATATLAYDAGVRRPTGLRQDFAARTTDIVVDAGATTTGTDGTFAWSGSGSASVTPGLGGAYVQIVNEAGALATATLTAQPAGTVRWSLAADEVGDAQLSAFIHAGIGKAKARALVPSLATWLDQPFPVHVNQPGSCNAMSTGDAIHFYRKSAMCENTARLADVVYHELGHAVHMHAIIAGAGAYNGSLSEGLSDYFAAGIVEDQAIGRGFTFDDKPVREIDPAGFERRWPEDRGLTAHSAGLIISGTLWDLRKSLIKKLGAAAGVARADALFVAVMQRSPDLTSAYVTALTADDDDGNLGNGTPNSCAIELAFGNHGLATGTFTTTTVGAPVVAGTTVTVPVSVPTGLACPPPQVTGVRVAWRIGSGATAMTGTFELAAGATAVVGTSWDGTFPALPDHEIVSYTVTAFLDDDSSVAYPQNVADREYQLFTGETREIWCEHFDAAPDWTTSGDDVWQWGTPGGFPASGDPQVAFTGESVFGTDLTSDGRYGNATTTAIETPEINVSMYDQVRLQYRRWLVVEDATYDRATIAVNGTTLWTNAMSTDGSLEHTDREWRFHDLDLTQQASGGTVKIKWAIASDTSRELGGWTLDDVCLVGIGKHAVCGDCVPDEDTGCCSTGTGPSGPVLLGLVIVGVLRRRRRHPIRPSRSRSPTTADYFRCAASRRSSPVPSRSVSDLMPK